MDRLTSAMSLTLFLAMALNTSGQDADKTTKDDQASAQGQTIRGTVAGVTVVGETMVDYKTNRAAIAQTSYLTILGSPGHGDAHHGVQGANPQKSSESRKDSSAEAKDNESGKGSQGDVGSAQRRRANVYLVAIMPQTKVCRDVVYGGDSSGEKSPASRDDPRQSQATFESLELGDRVEITFMNEGASSPKSIDSKHGRNRTFRGVATSITILLPEEEGDHRHASNSSSRQDDKPSELDEKK